MNKEEKGNCDKNTIMIYVIMIMMVMMMMV